MELYRASKVIHGAPSSHLGASTEVHGFQWSFVEVHGASTKILGTFMEPLQTSTEILGT